MKNLKLFLFVLIMSAINGVYAQWGYNGNNIYNTNSGNVGVGTDTPLGLLYVMKNTAEPMITIRNTGGGGGATYSMIDDLSGADWKFKATTLGGFKIRDHANSLDIITIEPNSFAHAFYIKNTGSIGIGTATPVSSALVDMNSTSKGFLPPRMTNTEMNAIQNPSNGLLVYCTDCSSDSNGRIALYMSGSWVTLSINNCTAPPSSPAGTNHISSATQIIWNWTLVAGATGYKWNTSDNYITAIDLGNSLTKTETGLACQTSFTRYIWAYNGCGNSVPIALNASTTNCVWSCGNTININHTTGSVAPVNKVVTYGTVTNVPGETSKCWITSNLGADHQASSKDDSTEASAGWYWQFNRMQGYKHDGTNRTPNTTWISIDENSDWISANDPCNIELGNGWRIPLQSEWINVNGAGGWTDWNGPWNSPLKMHTGGTLDYTDGSLDSRPGKAQFWANIQGSNTTGWYFRFNSTLCGVAGNIKAFGNTIRCVKD